MSTKPYNFDNFWAEYGTGVMAAYPAHEAANIRDLCRNSWMACIAMAPELPPEPPVPVDLEAILAKSKRTPFLYHELGSLLAEDIPALVAEVAALRSRLSEAAKPSQDPKPSLTDAGELEKVFKIGVQWGRDDATATADQLWSTFTAPEINCHGIPEDGPQPQPPGDAPSEGRKKAP